MIGFAIKIIFVIGKHGEGMIIMDDETVESFCSYT